MKKDFRWYFGGGKNSLQDFCAKVIISCRWFSFSCVSCCSSASKSYRLKIFMMRREYRVCTVQEKREKQTTRCSLVILFVSRKIWENYRNETPRRRWWENEKENAWKSVWKLQTREFVVVTIVCARKFLFAEISKDNFAKRNREKKCCTRMTSLRDGDN